MERETFRDDRVIASFEQRDDGKRPTLTR